MSWSRPRPTPVGSGTTTSAASTCCWPRPRPRPGSEVLRDQGVTPERIEAAILRTIGRGQTADPLGGLDRQALASIGIDLDAVRARIEAAFGPDALTRGPPDRLPEQTASLGEGPLAELTRRRRRRHAGRNAPQPAGPTGNAPLLPGPVPAAISRSRRAPRRAWSSRCARRRRCTTPASASSTSPLPCSPEGRHGTGDPVGPRRTGHVAARRHPHPLPKGELIRTPTWPPFPQALQGT